MEKKREKQESPRAYGTAVSRLVINLNEIHLNHSQIWGVSEHDPNPNPKSATCLVGVC